jgi:hypothetical protein
MRTYLTVMAFLMVSFIFIGNTSGGVDWGLNFSTQRMTGHTKFDIEVNAYFPELGSDVKVESELEFPLDVILIGGGLTVKGKFKTGET